MRAHGVRALAIGAGTAFALVVVAWAWIQATYLPRYPFWASFLEAWPGIQLTMAATVIAGIAAVDAAFGQKKVRGLVLIGLAVALGALGAALGEMNARFGVLYHGDAKPFVVTVPSRLEALSALGLGLGLAFSALIVLLVRRPVRS